MAKALFDCDPDDALHLTSYAGTCRRTGQPGTALALFREHGARFPGERGVFYEWSVAAGAAGDHGLDVWLAARSVSDDRVPLNSRQVKLSLAGLGAAFRDLAQSASRPDFAVAQAACGRLGLRLRDLDPTTRGYLEEHTKAAKRPAGAAPAIETDIATLRAAVIDAALEAEPTNDPPFFEGLIGDPDAYRYTMLARQLSGNHPPAKR